MTEPTFQPGFRLSASDIGVLIVGSAVSVAVWQIIWWLGFVISFVLAHFFLFCNIVRMSRPLELVWSASFVVLAGSTILTDLPGWTITILVSIALTVVLVCIEARRPSYHGVAWQRLNPGLRSWWQDRMAGKLSNSI